MATILLVEDDTEIRTLIKELLLKQNWCVIETADGLGMDQILSDNTPDVILLDINLPGEDGLSICKRLTSETNISILMLTARSDDIDRIIGLEIGADDYLGKPFHPRELVARVKALLRRSAKVNIEVSREQWRVSGLIIDKAARTVIREADDEVIGLSSAEFDLLYLLAAAKGQAISRDVLLDRIHGRATHPYDRAIDVLVSRLRKKIDQNGPSLIQSVRNAGYLLRS